VADVLEVALRPAEPADAAEMAAVIRAAFGARPRAGRPASGLTETADSVMAKLEQGGGFVGETDGRIAAVVLVRRDGPVARLARVCVLPGYQHHGLAVGLVRESALHLAAAGVVQIQAGVRREYPGLLQWWLDNDFEQIGEAEDDDLILVGRLAPQYLSVPDADEMRALGERIAAALRPGDVLIEAGELGAGKTTLTQGIGAGLRVDRPIISPTFVLSRVHPSLTGGPALVHVAAYRLGSWDELEDLDLDQTLADAVTVIEWGTGIAEPLAAERLEIDIRRDDPASDVRQVFLTGIGPRWEGVRL
jgi:tRNA threonylcarbamoyladenosine biosynthesis protein TsaE